MLRGQYSEKKLHALGHFEHFERTATPIPLFGWWKVGRHPRSSEVSWGPTGLGSPGAIGVSLTGCFSFPQAAFLALVCLFSDLSLVGGFLGNLSLLPGWLDFSIASSFSKKLDATSPCANQFHAMKDFLDIYPDSDSSSSSSGSFCPSFVPESFVQIERWPCPSPHK